MTSEDDELRSHRRGDDEAMTTTRRLQDKKTSIVQDHDVQMKKQYFFQLTRQRQPMKTISERNQRPYRCQKSYVKYFEEFINHEELYDIYYISVRTWVNNV